MQVDVLSLGDVFEVPVVMIQGSEDIVTVTALVRAYFDRISAPHKDFVLIPGDGHLALLKVRDNFLSAVTAHLRLVLVRSASPVGET
jgi:pimeloyl-ACP methyl ester carboxylesterase